MIDGCISVIIPVYNVEKYLEQCLRSISTQTYKNIDIIIIDDGSTDKSSEICDVWGKRDPRITVRHTENRGVSAARNLGLSLAKGEFVFFCDSDDYLEKDALQCLYDEITAQRADMIIANYRRVNEQGETLEEKNLWNVESVKVLSEQQVWEGVKYYMAYVISTTKLYRREIWNNIFFPDFMLHEDQNVLQYVFPACKRIVGYNKIVYNYRVTPNSIMTKNFRVQNLDFAKHLLSRIDYLLGRKDVDNALYFWGVGTRLLLQAYDELDMKENIVHKTVKELRSNYCIKAMYLVLFLDSKKQKARLFLFSHFFVIYRVIYMAKNHLKENKEGNHETR